MIVKIEEINNESDVEQKLIYPLMVAPRPQGLGLSHSHIQTKPNIKSFQIEKRQNKKRYYPDYVIVVSGLPVIIVEAKPPSDDLDEAYREARLYAIELNAIFPHSLNPVTRIICSNGQRLIAGYWDTDTPTYDLSLSQLNASDSDFYNFVDNFNLAKLQIDASKLLKSRNTGSFVKPTKFIGGQSVRNEEIGGNSFGNALALEYRHLFNPTTREERAYIVKNAYIPSKRKERYIQPIDRIIRAASSPAQSDAKIIPNTKNPKVLIDVIRKGKTIENQVILLVGGVGTGKSTFVDYLREVALPDDIKDTTVWLNINMNNAPISFDIIYNWICEQIISDLQRLYKEIDFDELENIEKLYSVEIGKLKKGVLKLLDENSEQYRKILVEKILELQNDKVATTQAYIRYLCAERGKLAIVVIDNCDKRIRDEQLLMFQAAQWIQREFRCLIFLPIRDITYDLHRHEPPLDTALKDLVFRIEPPKFQDVLSTRITLALKEMQDKSDAKTISYKLPNAMRVSYPAEDLAYYLNSILKSLFEYDIYLRGMIVGLAGRDIRKAMEIFIEFCTSGHITEDEIFKICQSEGKHPIPYHIVSRVLLRMNRRFYHSDSSYIKNLFHCEPSDSNPVYFIRLAILRWLHLKFKVQGPTRLPGYHSVEALKSDLFLIGLSDEAVSRELIYLLQARCIIAEHLRVDCLDDTDLISLAPAGFVHIDLTANIDYLSAVAEDTSFDNKDLARNIARRISDKKSHYNLDIALVNAKYLVNYLQEKLQDPFPSPETFLEESDWRSLVSIEKSYNTVEQQISERKNTNPLLSIVGNINVGDIIEGTVDGKADFGIFVKLKNKIIGLAHISNIKNIKMNELKQGDKIKVRILTIDEATQKISLAVN